MNDLTRRMSRIEPGKPREMSTTAAQAITTETLEYARRLMWRHHARLLIDRYADILPRFAPGPAWIGICAKWLIAMGERGDTNARALIHSSARLDCLVPVQVFVDALIDDYSNTDHSNNDT